MSRGTSSRPPSGAPRSIGVENSLIASRVPEIQKLLKSMDAKVKQNLSLEDVKMFLDSSCSQIMKIKQIKPELHRQFVQSMTVCLRQIWGYKQLVLDVENLRQVYLNFVQIVQIFTIFNVYA